LTHWGNQSITGSLFSDEEQVCVVEQVTYDQKSAGYSAGY
jgi:hypothetical protein